MATSSSTFRPRLAEQGQPPASQQVPRRDGKGEEEEETRDWAELPRDALLAVLCRLDQADVLMGAEHVCRPWRRAAREEPELWRRVDLRGHVAQSSPAAGVLKAMAYAAARRGGERCEAFWVEGVRDDSFVFFLCSAAPALKSLRLISCNMSTTHGLIAGIRKLPMLEDLELSFHSDAASDLADTSAAAPEACRTLQHHRLSRYRSRLLYSDAAANQGLYDLADTCAAAAEACPLLKRLRLNRYRFDWGWEVGDGEAMEIARMRGLESLQLFGSSLSNDGLAAILDGCGGLMSLDIRHCFNVEMDDEMRAKCARVRTLRLPHDSMDDYGLRFGSPVMEPGSPDQPSSPGDPDNIFSSWYFR